MLVDLLCLTLLLFTSVFIYMITKRKGDPRGGVLFVVSGYSVIFAVLLVVSAVLHTDWPWFKIMIGVLAIMTWPLATWLGLNQHKQNQLNSKS